ncbi:MAG: hypothetical protein PVI22_15380, partial [Lysobacterales bacterium]
MKRFDPLLPQTMALFTPLTLLVAPCYAADYLTVTEAQAELFPGADTFSEQNILLTRAQLKAIKKRTGVRQRNPSPPVWRVERAGEFLGWFFVDDVIGKHEFITYAIGIDPQGEVLGLEIMSYRETHGGEVREADWRQKFEGKTLDDPFKLGQDVPNIS